MKQELEIGGKVYTLVANRNVSTLMEKCVKVDSKGNTNVEIPDNKKVFVALLRSGQPELSEIECLKLLEQADNEYGIAQMDNAIRQMLNSVFTQDSTTSPKKTISWLKVENQEEEKVETL